MRHPPYGPKLPNRPRQLAALCLAVVGVIALEASAGDWPQWRGLRRDGATTERIATSWPASGPTSRPREIWHAEVGLGHAPVSIAAGRVVTLGYTGQADTVWCFDAATGQELWRYDYAASPRQKVEPGNGAYDGPHAAPAIHQGRVYTLSRDGQVLCLDLAKGDLKWRRDLQADLKAKLPECGFAGSPLILGNLVIVSVGLAGTALDLATGQTKWHSGGDMAGYGAPVPVEPTVVRLNQDTAANAAAVAPAPAVTPASGPATAPGRTGTQPLQDAQVTNLCYQEGQPMLLFFGYKELLAVAPADGKALWNCPWPTQYGANVADPIVLGDAVFITCAYGRGCGLVELASGKVRWQSKLISSQCSPLVLREGALYGFDGYINYRDAKNPQALVCLDPINGTAYWRKDGLAGQLILADDKLVMLLTNGDLVVARATTQGYEELARSQLQKPEDCPIPPSLVNGRLYCRTGKGQLTCYDVAP